MLLHEQVHGDLSTTLQSWWQCHLESSDHIHCLKHGCRLISSSQIHFPEPPHGYWPISFHEFGTTIASLTPDKDPNKSEHFSANSLFLMCLLFDTERA